jgi:hypothetical protein
MNLANGTRGASVIRKCPKQVSSTTLSCEALKVRTWQAPSEKRDEGIDKHGLIEGDGGEGAKRYPIVTTNEFTGFFGV